MEDSWLEVGRIVAAQGIRGEVRVQPLTDFPERLRRRGLRRLQHPGGKVEERELLNGRPLPGKELYVCRFLGVEDRNAAEALVGASLWAAAARPALAEGEFWLPDLLDLPVLREDTGALVGRVVDLTRAGNDLLVIERPTGERLLVPLVAELVPEVDLVGRRVVVRPIPGLLDPAEAEVVDAPDRL